MLDAMMRVMTGSRTADRFHLRAWVVAFCLCLTACGPARDGTVKADAATGYCPVCKMKVNAADEWAAEIYYTDGTKLLFESPGDLMMFFTAPGKYKATPAQQERANITKILLKDYQTKQPTDARQAALVINSRVEGPMGPDFIPFNSRADADAFVIAKGGKIISLSDVTPEMAQNLRSGY
jgi:nitrous oxide reductase accessory protein NosL